MSFAIPPVVPCPGARPILVLADVLPMLQAQHEPPELARWLVSLLPAAWPAAKVLHSESHPELIPNFTMLERWLARHVGLSRPLPLSIAQAARWFNIPNSPEDSAKPAVLLARLVHWQATRDHIVLQPVEPAALNKGLAERITALAQVCFADIGWQFVPVADDPEWATVTPPCNGPLGLEPRSSAVAFGRNIESYLPTGVQARDWRRLHNELQMVLWNDPQLQRLQESGSRPVNGLWLEGHLDMTQLRQWKTAAAGISVRTDIAALRSAIDITPVGGKENAADLVVLGVPNDPGEASHWWDQHRESLTLQTWDKVVLLGAQHWVELDPNALAGQFAKKGFGRIVHSLFSRVSQNKPDPAQQVLGWLQ